MTAQKYRCSGVPAPRINFFIHHFAKWANSGRCLVVSQFEISTLFDVQTVRVNLLVISCNREGVNQSGPSRTARLSALVSRNRQRCLGRQKHDNYRPHFAVPCEAYLRFIFSRLTNINPPMKRTVPSIAPSPTLLLELSASTRLKWGNKKVTTPQPIRT